MNPIIIGLIVLMVVIFWNTSRYQNFQILGVTFTPEHANSTEVRQIQKRFRIEEFVIALVFAAFGFLVQLEMFQGKRDMLFMIILVSYMFLSYLPFVLIQKRLRNLKLEKEWIYNTEKRTADISVSREKGKSAPKKHWIWLSWLLSVVPFFVVLFKDNTWGNVAISLFIPLIMLLIPLSYPMVIRTKTPFVSKNSDLAKTYMRHYERINAVSYIQVSFAVNAFFIVLVLSMIYSPSNLLFVSLLLGFVVILIGIMVNATRKNQTLHKDFFNEDDLSITESKAKYKWGAYYDPADTRLFVPKRIGMGVTINIARPAGKIIMGFTYLLTISLVGFAIVMFSISEFEMSVEADSFEVHAPIYGVEIDYDQIESIELSQEPLEGIRTNGFGGFEKRFGYFNMDGYGPARLYDFSTDHSYHVDILLIEGKSPRWIIFNQLTEEDTKALYDELITNWKK